jgi:hypothetical protein
MYTGCVRAGREDVESEMFSPMGTRSLSDRAGAPCVFNIGTISVLIVVNKNAGQRSCWRCTWDQPWEGGESCWDCS